MTFNVCIEWPFECVFKKYCHIMNELTDYYDTIINYYYIIAPEGLSCKSKYLVRTIIFELVYLPDGTWYRSISCRLNMD